WRASVTQIRVIRGRLYNRQIGMRLRLVLLDRLDEAIDDVARIGDRQLGEKEAELLVVGFGEAGFDVGGQIPEPLLEGSDRLLPRLVEELFVGVARFALVLGVLS